MRRRAFLLGSMVAAATAGCAGRFGFARRPALAAPVSAPAAFGPDLEDLQERTFRFFWETTNPRNGLAHDRWPTRSFSSVAAVGFALTAYPIGVERGWITRAQGRERTLTTLRFLWNAPQGDAPSGVAGHRGFFYHFLDMETGHRFEQTELSTVDTALMLGGALFAAQYFDGSDAGEAEIRSLARSLYERVEWPWAQVRGDLISMGWRPESGHLEYDWHGYNEGMIVVLLALGSPTHPVGPGAWRAWTEGYARSWTDSRGEPHLHFAPMFGHQYSHVWVDFRGVRDGFMREKGIDYFENSRRATYAQQRYAIENPGGWRGYAENVWGLTACDGPGDFAMTVDGRLRHFFSYSARGPGERDDGTLAPTAAAASIAFAPEIAIPCVREMRRLYGADIYGRYGFLDSFNPTLVEAADLKHGSIKPGTGWVDGDYLGIDQGPIVAMMENHRSGLIWRHMRDQPDLRRGLERAGFTGGWLEG